MKAQILSGKLISEKIRSEIQSEVQKIFQEKKIIPGLAVVLVGKDPASQIYVKNKIQACEKAGIKSFAHFLPEDIKAAELQSLLEQLEADPKIHGILVQLPLPKHLKNFPLTQVLSPHKDVDGLHPQNLGNLVAGLPGFRSCTPFGIMKMLEQIQYDLTGKKAVVVGRSTIVGKPIALMLLEKNATVTICHSRTHDLESEIRAADVVVAAVGIPEFVRGEWIKPGAVVIDVGINRLESGKVVGDVEFEAASEKASWITPVPGGVGPMTIAMLLWNTLQAAKSKA